MGNYVRNCTQTWTRMSNIVYVVHIRISKSFVCVRLLQRTRLTAFALDKSVFSGIFFVCKNLHTEKVLQVKSFGCTSFRVGQRWNTRRDMLIVTHRHVFIRQQVNDPRRSRRRRRCGRPAMQQSAGADERNSSHSLEDRNPGAQLNDSFQFNRATMVTSEHKSTAVGATLDKQQVSGYS